MMVRTMVVGGGGRDLRQEEAELAADASAGTSAPAGVRGGDGPLPPSHLVELHLLVFFVARGLSSIWRGVERSGEEEEGEEGEEDRRRRRIGGG